MKALVLAMLVACSSKSEAPPPKPTPPPTEPELPAISQESLLLGLVPEGGEGELINTQCRICHSVEYLTQQRLSEAAWKKTIDKMRTFGAVLTDAEAARLATFNARYWNPDLPDRTYTPVLPPVGAY